MRPLVHRVLHILVPIFLSASATTAYTVSVDHGTTEITLTPTLSEQSAAVTVAYVTPATAVNLDVGLNPIAVTVTSSDNTTTKTYTVTVTRAP